VGIVLWIIYLRYLLAKKSMETQAELDKFKLQLTYQGSHTQPLQIENQPDPSSQSAMPRITEGENTDKTP
jgi:hypothetical protein